MIFLLSFFLISAIFFTASEIQAAQLGAPADRDGAAALATLFDESLSETTLERFAAMSARKPIYRNLPTQQIHCYPEVLAFFSQHPDVMVAIWERFGATELSLTPLENPRMFALAERGGTRSVVEQLHFRAGAQDGLSLWSVRGAYRGTLFPKEILGEAILLFRWRIEDAKNATEMPLVTCRLDAFVAIHHQAAEAIARMLTPVVGKIADSNFEQTLLFVQGLCEEIAEDRDSMRQMIYRLASIPKETRRECGSVLDGLF